MMRIHPSERGFDLPKLPGRERIEAHMRCQLFGIGESSSSSSTVDSRSVADNESDLTNISSVAKSNVAADGGALIQGSNVVENGVQLQGGSRLQTGGVAGNVSGNVQVGASEDLLRSLVGTFADSTRQQVDTLKQLVETTTQPTTPAPSPTPATPSSQVEPESWWTTGRKWAVGIVVASLLGWMLFPKKGRA